MSNNILQYESKVWSTADLLIGAGTKQSDFPKIHDAILCDAQVKAEGCISCLKLML